jgi:Putative beta-barrel porin-2, OmpL-like. bbp2
MRGNRAIPSGKARRRAVGLVSWVMVVGLCVANAQGEEQDTRRNAPTASPLIPPPRQFGGFFGVDGRRPGAEARPVITPSRRFDLDPAVYRAQAGAPSTPAPGTGAGSSPAPAPTGSTTVPDLSLPAEERAIGGGEPTEVTAEEEAQAEPPQQITTLLMRALQMRDSPVKVYGWLQNSFTGNANGRGNGQNFGVNPNHLADQWMGNQYYLIIENPIEQTDSVNFGFRIDNMLGNDWQFNYMQGLFNRAYPPNQFAGYDLSQLYGEAHLPILTPGGLDVKGGLWYSLAGYEQVPAIARPLLSVPYMFNYGQPFRHVGVVTTLHLTPGINLYNGTINGWDRWIDERYIWGYIGGFSWVSRDGKTNIAFTCVWGPDQFPRFLPGNQPIYPDGYINIPSLAGLPNPGYAHNDRTLFTTVVTHKWSSKLTEVFETDQGWELNVPGLASNGANGAPKTAEWFSIGNWFLYQFSPKLTGVLRSEVFWDPTGARTGYADTYYEETLGLVFKPKDYIWIRPEARYDWAQSGKPYSNDTRSSQFTLGFDVIFLF